MSQDDNIQLLKEILTLKTYSGEEQEVIQYVVNWCEKHQNDLDLEWFVDEMGNVYIIKGNTSVDVPLVIGHMDSVHKIQDKEIVVDEDNEVMYGICPETHTKIGCGGDDLVSIFCGLKLLENNKKPNIKVCFYVSEEPGCIGSKYSVMNHPEFYNNIMYVIMVDSPLNQITEVCSGTRLFNPNGNFFKTIQHIIWEMFPEMKRKNHPYSDVKYVVDHLRQNNNMVEGINFCGFYEDYHTRHEKVHYNQLFRGLKCIEKMISALGNQTYQYVEPGDELEPNIDMSEWEIDWMSKDWFINGDEKPGP